MKTENLAIEFQAVSKQYKLGQFSHGMLSKDLQSWWAKVRNKPDPNSQTRKIHSTDAPKQDSFYAINDVSFKIGKGEVIGVIGRNGAGKSTLLKLLSKITYPSSGTIHYNGKIASLLEVGTGFHPELTGRENIMLNGAILGMSRREMLAKLPDIIEFAGIQQFIDTPVKRYSSGMYVRLAFAVAAHLQPDILVIDEVLAVGDAEFQKKCLGKMESISKESGRTILFVSHNMAAVTSLCTRVIYLQRGEIRFDGPTREGIDCYLRDSLDLIEMTLDKRQDRAGDGNIRFVNTWTEDENGNLKNIFLSGETMVIAAQIQLNEAVIGTKITSAFQLHDPADYVITDLNTKSKGVEFHAKEKGFAVLRCAVNRLPLVAGLYNYDAIVRADDNVEDFIITAGKFQVEEGDFFASGKTYDKGHGIILVDQDWSYTPKE